MTLNLLCSFENVMLTNYVVGALDEEVYALLKSKGHPVIAAYKESILGGDELASAVKHKE